MAQTASNVRVGVTGGVYRAPVGTTLPTDSLTPLPVDWKEVGYLTDAGVTTNWFQESTNDIRAWQNGELVRRVLTEITSTASFSMLESNDEVRKAYYGDGNVSAGHIRVSTDQGVRGPWVIVVDDGVHHDRIVINDAQVTERGEIVYVNGDAVMYSITLTCYPVNGSPADIYYSQSIASS